MKYVRGIITHGEGWGRRLGFPTANLRKPTTRAMPVSDGIYAAWGRIGNETTWRKAILLVGAPAFFRSKAKKLEIYFLDFTGDLYGKRVAAKIIQRLRPMRKYHNTGELIAQIKKDIKEAKVILTDDKI